MNTNNNHKDRNATSISYQNLFTFTALALLLTFFFVTLASCDASDPPDSSQAVRPDRETSLVTTETAPPATATPDATSTTTSTSTAETTPVVTIITVNPPLPTPGQDFEARVRQLINQERTSRDLSELSADQRLQAAAEAHSRYMAENQVLSHTGVDDSSPGERITAQNYDWIFYAENVACGYFTPQDLVDGWMQSEGHRENMLHPEAQEIGVGLVFDPQTECVYYWTAEFAAPTEASGS